ncbi:hypothetical protein [Aeromicrobium alkaliterrae]|uniref:Uncharacterized protein n=1 Tax=Aeromicrobium alkaliterrae TaxID=302168 RepID=A0ABP4VZV3_9ACTN
MKLLTRSGRGSRLAASTAAALSLLFVATASPASAANPTLTVKYDAVGTSYIGSQVDSTLPIGPSELTTTLDLVDGKIVAGSLPIPTKQLQFDVFGIPARANVTLTQVGTLTGQLEQTDQLGKARLTSNVSYDIKISKVEAKVFGIWFPLSVGSNCHTIKPVNITASTPAGEFFTVNEGGRVTGNYTIGNFTGCTPLNFFDIPGFFPWFGSVPINALVPGSNNSIDLTISNPRYGG